MKNHKTYSSLQHDFTDEELELLNIFRKIEALNGKISNVNGERAEKKVYKYLQKCIKDKETVIVNNFKIMTVPNQAEIDNDKPAQEVEKDFVIFHLKKRAIISMEIKYKYTGKTLDKAIQQTKNCKDLILKWCKGELLKENGWKFFSVPCFDQISDDQKPLFCQECSKFVIIGDEFGQKFPRILEDIPEPLSGTEAKAREEFKGIVKILLFLASAEPVITPRRITPEVVKMVEKAGTEENILFWNSLLFYKIFFKMFCWTPLQLSFLKDQSLKNVIFTSPPSCGKTVLKKAKVKYFGQEKGEDVVFLVPCYQGKQTLLFHHLKKEFGSLNNEHIKVDNVNFHFGFDEEDLMDKINNKYRWLFLRK